jgi:hypothetical protein
MKPGKVTVLHSNAPLDMIPLAAFLLEYPVGYVAASSHAAFLDNVPLEIYEVSQRREDTE